MNRASASNDKKRNFNSDKVFGDTCLRALFATIHRDPPLALYAIPGRPLSGSKQPIFLPLLDGFATTVILFSS
jgi:hypothetical protein